MGLIPEFLSSIYKREKPESVSPPSPVEKLPRRHVYRFINGDPETAQEAQRFLNKESRDTTGKPLSPGQIDDLGQMRHLAQEKGISRQEMLRLRYPRGGGNNGRAA